MATPAPEPSAASATRSAAVDVTGVFESNWGAISLEQSGSRVWGTYECCGGGRIKGAIRDGVLDYEWHQPGASGRGRWTVKRGGSELVGTWGVGASATSGGPWNLSRPAQLAN